MSKSEIMVTSFRNFIQHGGQVCNKCMKSGSQGERRIKQYLERNNIEFVQEKVFQDCKDIRPLPFDFYLPRYNVIIEYDGEQHFTDRGYKTNRFRDTLEYTQYHDDVKNSFCKRFGIKLIRIPYWKYNSIEAILEEALCLHEDIV